MKFILLLAFLAGSAVARQVGQDRNERLLVTTETLTVTVVTDSHCFTTDKKLLGPKTKECTKKRAIDISSIEGLTQEEASQSIKPSVTRKEAETGLAVIGTSKALTREERFCCYAVTKTETSTIYQITATTTVTFKCTPSSSILNMCDEGDKKDKPFKDKFTDLLGGGDDDDDDGTDSGIFGRLFL
jgi:hypothetical protein